VYHRRPRTALGESLVRRGDRDHLVRHGIINEGTSDPAVGELFVSKEVRKFFEESRPDQSVNICRVRRADRSNDINVLTFRGQTRAGYTFECAFSAKLKNVTSRSPEIRRTKLLLMRWRRDGWGSPEWDEFDNRRESNGDADVQWPVAREYIERVLRTLLTWSARITREATA
jgi:hypothetical protein